MSLRSWTKLGNFTVLAALGAIVTVGCRGHPPDLYGISGTISGANSAVTITIEGPYGGTTTTDPTGKYALRVLNGSYVVTPSLSGYVFDPASSPVTVNGGLVTGVDFTGAFVGPRLTVLAGQPSGDGNLDGTGSDARFNHPSGVAVDRRGDVYVADEYNNTIRRITPLGVTTLAGAAQAGSIDGTRSDARFNHPSGVAVDRQGDVYVADCGNSTIRKITSSGEVSTFAGAAGQTGSIDATGSDARFYCPYDVTVDASGNVYVTDAGTIRKITPAGVVTTLAGAAGQPPGSTDGTGSDARFNYPSGVAVDASGNLYVADRANSTIRKITPAGVVTTLAGAAGQTGSIDATGSDARFNEPYDVAVDASGNVYVVDSWNHTIRKITPAGAVTTLAGAAGQLGSTDGTGSSARFDVPSGVVVDASGTLYVADKYNNAIRKIMPAGDVSTLAGVTSKFGSTDGTGSAARFHDPLGLAVDGSGSVYVADFSNSTIRKITPMGEVTTLAGAAGQTGSTDDIGPAARFNYPYGVAVDGSGNLYVTDWGSRTIRKITPGGAVTTLAGAARQPPGSTDATGSDARFTEPRGVAVDGSGNLFVADSGNSTIRKITPAGVVTTLAGAAGQTGSTDGTGSDARFNGPCGVAVDGPGNVYVTDRENSTIRKITPAGLVTTLAGAAGQTGNTDGTGSNARFKRPSGVALDGFGNLYVADVLDNTVRKITPAGTVTTVVGTAWASGTIAGYLPASLFWPVGVAFAPTTNTLFITVPDAILKVQL